MASEKIVSSVFFRGSKVSTSELAISDSSNPPTYTITYSNGPTAAPNAQNVQIGRNTLIKLQQSPISPTVKKVYYRAVGDDSYRFSLSGLTITTGPMDGSIVIDDQGVGILVASMNNSMYPNIKDNSFTVDLYHDEQRTAKIATVTVGTPAVKNPKLEIRPLRNMGDIPIKPLSIYQDEIFNIRYSDENSEVTWNPKIKFKLTVDGSIFQPGTYFDDSPGWIKGQYVDEIFYSPGYPVYPFTQLISKRNPAKRGRVAVTAFLGDLSATNYLEDAGASWLRGYETLVEGPWGGFKNVPDPIPIGSSSIYNDHNVSIGYSFRPSNPVPPASDSSNPPWLDVTRPHPGMYTLTQLVTERTADQQLKMRGVGFDDKLNNNLFLEDTYGYIDYLAWEHGKLDTAKKRKQFGKYQKTLTAIYRFEKGSNGYTLPVFVAGNMRVNDDLTVTGIRNTSYSLDDVKDLISDSTHGPLLSLNNDILATFCFSTRDASLVEDMWTVTTSVWGSGNSGKAFPIGATMGFMTTPPLVSDGTPNHGLTRLDYLFIRNNGSNEINTFDPDTAYPRIINVQTKRGYEPYKWSPHFGTFWDFTIDPSLGVDLTDMRYSFMTSIHNDSDWGFELNIEQSVTLIARSPHKVTFKFNGYTTNPSMSFAVVEKSPFPQPQMPANFNFKTSSVDSGGLNYIIAGKFKGDTTAYGTFIKSSDFTSYYSIFLACIQSSNTTNAGAKTDGIRVNFFDEHGGHTEDNFSMKPETLWITMGPIKYRVYRHTDVSALHHEQQYFLQSAPGSIERTTWRNALDQAKNTFTNIFVSLF